jgi:hypothetical protein
MTRTSPPTKVGKLGSRYPRLSAIARRGPRSQDRAAFRMTRTSPPTKVGKLGSRYPRLSAIARSGPRSQDRAAFRMTRTSPPTKVGKLGSRYPRLSAITFLCGGRLGVSDRSHPKLHDNRKDRHNHKGQREESTSMHVKPRQLAGTLSRHSRPASIPKPALAGVLCRLSNRPIGLACP